MRCEGLGRPLEGVRRPAGLAFGARCFDTGSEGRGPAGGAMERRGSVLPDMLAAAAAVVVVMVVRETELLWAVYLCISARLNALRCRPRRNWDLFCRRPRDHGVARMTDATADAGDESSHSGALLRRAGSRGAWAVGSGQWAALQRARRGRPGWRWCGSKRRRKRGGSGKRAACSGRVQVPWYRNALRRREQGIRVRGQRAAGGGRRTADGGRRGRRGRQRGVLRDRVRAHLQHSRPPVNKRVRVQGTRLECARAGSGLRMYQWGGSRADRPAGGQAESVGGGGAAAQAIKRDGCAPPLGRKGFALRRLFSRAAPQLAACCIPWPNPATTSPLPRPPSLHRPGALGGPMPAMCSTIALCQSLAREAAAAPCLAEPSSPWFD